MKIAIVAPVMIPIPPPNYGGIERIVSELAFGLAGRGHEITVFCSGGSTISGNNLRKIETTPYPVMQDLKNIRAWEEKEIRAVLAMEKEFDAIHFNYEPVILRFGTVEAYKNLLDDFTVPVVLTFHNSTDVPAHQAYYKSAISLRRHTAIFISENQRSRVPFFPKSMVIYNGIPVEEFSVADTKENFLLFLGRINPVKGVLEAISVAKKTNIPLIIAAQIDAGSPGFFEQEVKPLIDGTFVRYVGEVGFRDKVEYLKNARVLLFPIRWEEPFGLVMIEALACGTPVVAFRRGSVPEIIQDGINGYIVNTLEEMVRAVPLCDNISPRTCRKSVEGRFSVERMVNEYEDVFKRLAEV
ncbi:MAG: glycosyltransferase family 4 protein [bacterium]|nr:glycosyltransferase family 4 protein [bacterium]